jgi:hypothetical protein
MSTQGNPTIDAVLSDSASSDWLKGALRNALNRDPLDAACDAHLLCQLLEQRSDGILESEMGKVASA